jgi:DNA-binding CsgD family transcriptional regulator
MLAVVGPADVGASPNIARGADPPEVWGCRVWASSRCAAIVLPMTVSELDHDHRPSDHAMPFDEGMALVHNATAVVYNGLGQYAQARDAAVLAGSRPQELHLCTLVLPELIEAATRCGDEGRAADALEQLSRQTRAIGTEWALGLEARSRALLSDGPTADALHREAIRRLTHAGLPMALARAHLLYGEWLRRDGRRVDARAQLRIAHQMLVALELSAFAERARRELLATGATARRRAAETRDDLTAQEWQIARLAADRQTNAEIAESLFLSPRTVEWHLRKVFFKLGIGCRKDLCDVLPDVLPWD